MWAERPEWGDLVTLDAEESHRPDWIFDLSTLGDRFNLSNTLSARIALPFSDNHFDEIHAYEVLEHIGDQGDYRKFFAQFSEFWRVLKPNGLLLASVPRWDRQWAWGDPSHRRVITPGTLVFLDQTEYQKQVGKTPMSDFRSCYKADFHCAAQSQDEETFRFILQAMKPARISP